MKKKISIVVPCYNEVENIELAYTKLRDMMETFADKYDYEIVIEDNDSTDGTQEILRRIASENNKVKVILNMKNFGPTRSANNAFLTATGDAVIPFPADMQEPVDMFPEFIRFWEQGYLLVWGQKIKSDENPVKFLFRSIYYKIIKYFADTPMMEKVTGYGIYDRSVIEMYRSLDDPTIHWRHIVSELGYPVKFIPYKQNKREHGNSKYGIKGYFVFAVMSLIRTSTAPLHIAVAIGTVCSTLSFLLGIIYLVYKLKYWTNFGVGQAPILISVFFLGGILLLFLGLIGEYVGVILEKVSKRPLVVEKERINFENGKKTSDA